MSVARKTADVVRDEAAHEAQDHHAPGTFVLAIVFLLSFAVYFFANWKTLADVWHVR